MKYPVTEPPPDEGEENPPVFKCADEGEAEKTEEPASDWRESPAFDSLKKDRNEEITKDEGDEED